MRALTCRIRSMVAASVFSHGSIYLDEKMIRPYPPPISLSPQDFEKAVLEIIKRTGIQIMHFEVLHDVDIEASDGTYQIDVLMRHELSGFQYTTLIECKHHKSPIKREVVQILHDKVRSIGAHKGALFATCTFQRGALEYAREHGIALIQVSDGEVCYETRGVGPKQSVPSWVELPKYMGWRVRPTENGERLNLIDKQAEELFDN